MNEKDIAKVDMAEAAKEYFKKWRSEPENKKRIKKYQKEYYNKPKNKKRQKEWLKKYYKRNIKKFREESKIKNLMNYNRKRKNEIRHKVIEIIDSYKSKTILTLESKDFLFSRQLPKNKIYVFERDTEVYNLMVKNKPKNVVLTFGEVSNFADYDIHPEIIYLDFCQGYDSTKEILHSLSDKINKCKLLILTYCIRPGVFHNKDMDTQLFLIKSIQELTEINWKVIWGEAYSDIGCPMITIILENTIK